MKYVILHLGLRCYILHKRAPQTTIWELDASNFRLFIKKNSTFYQGRISQFLSSEVAGIGKIWSANMLMSSPQSKLEWFIGMA